MSSGIGTPTDDEQRALEIYLKLPDVLARNFIWGHDSDAMVMALDMYSRALKTKLGNPYAKR